MRLIPRRYPHDRRSSNRNGRRQSARWSCVCVSSAADRISARSHFRTIRSTTSRAAAQHPKVRHGHTGRQPRLEVVPHGARRRRPNGHVAEDIERLGAASLPGPDHAGAAGAVHDRNALRSAAEVRSRDGRPRTPSPRTGRPTAARSARQADARGIRWRDAPTPLELVIVDRPSPRRPISQPPSAALRRRPMLPIPTSFEVTPAPWSSSACCRATRTARPSSRSASTVCAICAT